MDIDRIKLEARLFASEYLLCNLYAMIFRGAPDPAATLAAFRDGLRSHMDGFTVAGLDPVQSDTFAGEVVFCMSLIASTLRESLPAERRVPGGVKVALCNYWFLLRDVRFIGFVMTGGCVMGSLFSYISGSPFVFIELHGVPPERYGLLFGLNAVGLIGASQLNHHLLKRYSSRAILRGSVVGFSIAAILVGVNAVTGIGGFVGFLVPLFVSVSALGFVSPNTTAAAMAMHGRIAGAASAFLGIAQFALGAVAASLVGLLADGTARPMGLMIAGCGLLALPMQHFSLRRRD